MTVKELLDRALDVIRIASSNLSRDGYRSFLEELKTEAAIRLDALDDDTAGEGKG